MGAEDVAGDAAAMEAEDAGEVEGLGFREGRMAAGNGDVGHDGFHGGVGHEEGGVLAGDICVGVER